MHWIYLKHEFHNLSWITEINELFHDILIYWDAPVYILTVAKNFWLSTISKASSSECQIWSMLINGDQVFHAISQPTRQKTDDCLVFDACVWQLYLQECTFLCDISGLVHIVPAQQQNYNWRIYGGQIEMVSKTDIELTNCCHWQFAYRQVDKTKTSKHVHRGHIIPVITSCYKAKTSTV